MDKLPTVIEQALKALGVNTNRINWKIHYWQQQRDRQRAAVERRTGSDGKATPLRKYKACRHCARVALAEDKVCQCGKRLPSYTGYRISKALAIDRPDFAPVSLGFMMLILALFTAMLMLDKKGGLMSPSRDALTAFGAYAGALLNEGDYWRVLTMALAHAGVIHLAFNAIAMSQMLPRIEQDVGPWRVAILITLTQLGAVIGHTVWYRNPLIPTVGASGVAFGLIGMGLAYAHRLGRQGERDFFVRWAIYGAIFGLMVPGINNAAHAGGLVVGLALGYWMGGREPRGAMRNAIKGVGVFCLILWAGALAELLRSVVNWLRQV